MDQIKIGDLLVVKKGHVSPVDLLVLDTGITKQGIKQFMTIENKVNGKENITYKSSIRNFSEDRHIKEKITNFENAISIIPNLDIELTYLSPEFTSLEKDNIGTFKLIKDPKVSIIRGKNLLYCGSKIISSW